MLLKPLEEGIVCSTIHIHKWSRWRNVTCIKVQGPEGTKTGAKCPPCGFSTLFLFHKWCWISQGCLRGNVFDVSLVLCRSSWLSGTHRPESSRLRNTGFVIRQLCHSSLLLALCPRGKVAGGLAHVEESEVDYREIWPCSQSPDLSPCLTSCSSPHFSRHNRIVSLVSFPTSTHDCLPARAQAAGAAAGLRLLPARPTLGPRSLHRVGELGRLHAPCIKRMRPSYRKLQVCT